MYNGIITLGKCLAISYKAKHAITIGSDNHTLGHLTPRNKNLHPYKHLYINTNVHGSCNHNSQKVEATQMSFSG